MPVTVEVWGQRLIRKLLPALLAWPSPLRTSPQDMMAGHAPAFPPLVARAPLTCWLACVWILHFFLF